MPFVFLGVIGTLKVWHPHKCRQVGSFCTGAMLWQPHGLHSVGLEYILLKASPRWW